MSDLPKYPVHTQLLSEAKLYALESVDYTANYDGWKDQDGTKAKMDRITIGRFGQLWVAEFCKLNNVPHLVDRTSPHLVDNHDLTITGKRIDVKTSVFSPISCQVSPGIFKKDPCDYFCFLLTDKALSYVQPLGFISSKEYKLRAQLVPCDTAFPGTSVVQRFKDGSLIMDTVHLIRFSFALWKVRETGNWVSAVDQYLKPVDLNQTRELRNHPFTGTR